jgi:hypothetical protein
VSETPYIWTGPGWCATLEMNDISHAALVAAADRLCREFGAVVVERYPEEGKEYWWVAAGGVTVMLMRKPPGIPLGLSVGPEGTELILRIAQAWGINRLVGWRWPLGRVQHWLSRSWNENPQR